MPAPDVEELLEAADTAESEREAKAVLNALSHTPGLTECPIAPDVLAKLLPDEGTVVLPKLKRIGGGPVYRLANVLSTSLHARRRSWCLQSPWARLHS